MQLFWWSLTFRRWTWWPVWVPVSAGPEAAGQPSPPGWGRREATAATLLWWTAAGACDGWGRPGGWRRPCRTGTRRSSASLWRTDEQKVSRHGDRGRLSLDRLIRFSKISVCMHCQADSGSGRVCLGSLWQAAGSGRPERGLIKVFRDNENTAWESEDRQPLIVKLLFKTLHWGREVCFCSGPRRRLGWKHMKLKGMGDGETFQDEAARQTKSSP